VDIDTVLELNRLAEQLSSCLTEGDLDRAVTHSMARKVAELSDRLLDVSGGKLLKIITTTIEPDSWDAGGGYGSILEYQGALIVSQTQDVHQQLQQLLDDLRKVTKANRGPATARPQLRRAASPRRRGSSNSRARGAPDDPFGVSSRGIGDLRRAGRDAAAEDDLFNQPADVEEPGPARRDGPMGVAPRGDARGGPKSDDVDTSVDDLFEAPPDDKAKKPQGDDG
jgi:hypothetical protein